MDTWVFAFALFVTLVDDEMANGEWCASLDVLRRRLSASFPSALPYLAFWEGVTPCPLESGLLGVSISLLASMDD
jgi:hypothetical protein